MNTLRPLSAFLTSALLTLAPVAAQVAPDLAERIKHEGLQNSKVMDYLRDLTANIGHRLTGSDNFTRACEWAAEEFEKMGLSNVHLHHWADWPVVWNREQWIGRVLSPVNLELQVATEAWTAGTAGRVPGRLVLPPKTAEEIDAFGEGWKQCYVLVPRVGTRPNPNLLRTLETKGVLGFVRSGWDGDAKFPTRLRVFGNQNVTWERRPTVPQIKVRSDQFDELVAMLEEHQRGEGPEVTVEFDIRNRWRKGPIALHNVIAEIPGSEKPDEVVIVCGHLDSWHQAQGTTDNGTGTTSTMEAARILAAVGARPKRTIRFMLWGGEEQGLLGSNAYVTKHRTQMDKVSAVFNHDTGTNWAHSLTITEAMEPAMRQVIEPVLSMQAPDPGFEGPVFELRVQKQISGGGGSDHASFLRAGVPAFPWGLRGRSNYFQYTWHTQWDTFDVAIPEYQRHTSTVIALVALGVANLPELLPREGVVRSGGGTDAKSILEGMLGVELEELTVKTVRADGVAQKAGFRNGDQIVAMGEVEVARARDVLVQMREQQPPFLVKVRRGDALVVLPMDRPAAAASRPAARRDGE